MKEIKCKQVNVDNSLFQTNYKDGGKLKKRFKNLMF